jgi:CheY-like chemotaxis protein
VKNQEEQKQEINIIKRVLLMEDDLPCQRIMINYLRKLSYQVDLIDDGIKAIQFLYITPYDLIIADIRLKGASGWEVIECVRDSESNAGTPLIVWSAFVNNPNDEEKYLAGGADGALTKWCTCPVLENKIQQCFLTPRYKRNFVYKFKVFQKKWLETYHIAWVKYFNFLRYFIDEYLHRSSFQLRQLIDEYLHWSNFHTKSEK